MFLHSGSSALFHAKSGQGDKQFPSGQNTGLCRDLHAVHFDLYGKPRDWHYPTLLSISIMTCGMLFALYSLKTLGRSFGIMPQARGLVQSGPYRLIMHPLYVGEIVAFGGAILTGFTIAKLGIFLVLAAIQSYRAIQEEKVLEETIPEYSMYKAATKRFIPGVI